MSDLVSPCSLASLDRFAMLTPVTPNPITTSTTIKSHGSESRTAAGHNQAEAQVVPQAAAHNAGIGLDAGTILSNVNAEAATAGNRTILQTLAMAVAIQLNIVRRNDETMDAFFLRIASAIDDMAPDEQLATEGRAGLKFLKISLPELSAALKQPESALAARLSAMAEAPMATPQKTAAAVATTTYLQEAASNPRAAETLAMVTQLRSNPEGNGLFSSNAPEADERQPSDARSLQMQLKSLFEPGVAETRMELSSKPEPAKAVILRTDGELAEAPAAIVAEEEVAQPATEETVHPMPDAADSPVAPQAEPSEIEQLQTEPNAEPVVLSSEPAEASQAGSTAAAVAVVDTGALDLEPIESGTASTATTDAAPAEKNDNAQPRPEPRTIGLPLSQSNSSPSLAMRIRTIAQELAPNKTPIEDREAVRSNASDQRVQTLLTLKGFAEVVISAPAKMEDAAPATPGGSAPKSDRADGEPAERAALAARDVADDGAGSDAAPASVPTARKDLADGRHAMPGTPVLPDTEDADPATAARHTAAAETATSAKASGEAQSGQPAKAVAGTLQPVAFAYTTLQPARDEFETKVEPEQGRKDDEDNSGDAREREDPEARRERLARKAIDDLLRAEPAEEPEMKITRDSSQADRAYALYQRMGGF